MNWEQWYCSNPACGSEAWIVKRDATARDIWLLAEHEDDSPFVVAAVDPVCPRCGTTLVGRLELNGRLVESAGAEDGPIFDFIRSLD